MKKLLPFLCFILISNAVALNMGPKRTAQCAWAPKTYNCSDEEKRKARKWFIAIPVTLAIAALAAIGIKATSDAVKEAKAEQAALDTKESYLREEYTRLGLKRADLQQKMRETQDQKELYLLQIQLTPTEERMTEITNELAGLIRK